jgi:hypothetical protein
MILKFSKSKRKAKPRALRAWAINQGIGSVSPQATSIEPAAYIYAEATPLFDRDVHKCTPNTHQCISFTAAVIPITCVNNIEPHASTTYMQILISWSHQVIERLNHTQPFGFENHSALSPGIKKNGDSTKHDCV